MREEEKREREITRGKDMRQEKEGAGENACERQTDLVYQSIPSETFEYNNWHSLSNQRSTDQSCLFTHNI